MTDMREYREQGSLGMAQHIFSLIPITRKKNKCLITKVNEGKVSMHQVNSTKENEIKTQLGVLSTHSPRGSQGVFYFVLTDGASLTEQVHNG